MLHLMTLPAGFVNAHSALRLQDGQAVFVFIPYKKDAIDGAIDLARNPEAARIIIHRLASEVRNEAAWPLEPPLSIAVDSDEDAEDEDEFSSEIESKIGGRATWLQDRIELSNKMFLLQILGSLFEKQWPSHAGMFMGGVLYLFIDPQTDGQSLQGGQLALQYS